MEPVKWSWTLPRLGYDPCPECNDGTIEVEIYHRQSFDRDSGYIQTRSDDCEHCDGTGEAPACEECEECEDGWIADERPVDLGGGPREDFGWVTYFDPCPDCNSDGAKPLGDDY